jgi:crossover junction endodeoxyribonuclease RuvC
MNKPKIILGIDPGYGRCGFGVIVEVKGEYRIVNHGVITTEKGEFPSRLLEVANDVEELIKAHKPTILGIEELFFAKNTTTALRVAEVRGAIMMLAQKHGLAIVEVKPNEVKMAMTGYGKADKKQIQDMVKTVFKLKAVPKPDDAADALAVAWTAAAKQRYV